MNVKLFKFRSYKDLEEAINSWLSENTTALIKDIKLTSATKTYASLESDLIAMVIYQL